MTERIHHKISLAVEQLETAIALFINDRNFCSALTLAGAAEEILGQALKIRGIENSLQEAFRTYHDSDFAWIHQPKTWSEFTTGGKNRVRNAIKHARDIEDLTVSADMEDEALWMIVRATDNFQRLGFGPTALMNEFDGWFYENVVGI